MRVGSTDADADADRWDRRGWRTFGWVLFLQGVELPRGGVVVMMVMVVHSSSGCKSNGNNAIKNFRNRVGANLVIVLASRVLSPASWIRNPLGLLWP